MAKLKLFFSNYDGVRLERFSFDYLKYNISTTTTRSRSSIYRLSEQDNIFTWTSAIRAFSQLCLATKLGSGSDALISGEEQTPAASLDYAISKEPGWLLDFFGFGNLNSRAFAKHLFIRKNSERKRPGPVEIRFDEEHVRNENISIFLDNELVSSPEILRELLENLESQSRRTAYENRARRSNLNKRTSVDGSAEWTYLISAVHLSSLLDPIGNKITYRYSARIKNSGNEALEGIQWSIISMASNPYSNLRVSSGTETILPLKVGESENLHRYLLKFPAPLETGATGDIILEYDVNNFFDRDDWLLHRVRTPTNELTLEFRCKGDFDISRHAVLAFRDDEILFGALPPSQLYRTIDNELVVRWCITNPPQGYQYRLFWFVEKRIAEPVPTRSAPKKVSEKRLSKSSTYVN